MNANMMPVRHDVTFFRIIYQQIVGNFEISRSVQYSFMPTN